MTLEATIGCLYVDFSTFRRQCVLTLHLRGWPMTFAGGSAHAWKLAVVDWRRGQYRNGLSIYMVDAFALAIGATIF